MMMFLKKVGFALFFGLLLTACPHKTHHRKVESIVAEYRGTKERNQSKHAFKRILREYVHGGSEDVTDAQLEADFEAYVTLSKQEVESFLEEQSCMPRSVLGAEDAEGARYYMANVAHQRNDQFYAKDQPPHHVSGSGNQHAHAAFTANMLLERYPVSADKPFPKRAETKGNPLPDFAALTLALTDETRFNELFLFKDEARGQVVFDKTKTLDYSKVTADLFMAPELAGGQVFSPALFASFVVRSPDEGKPFAYLVVSADAQGTPETPYVGLVQAEPEEYWSETGFAFTYLSTAKNLLSHQFHLTGDSPLAFELVIRTAYPKHPDDPYLTVKSTMIPAVSPKTVTKYRESRLTRLILMIRKGALMRDLIKLYYPNSSALKLWNDVGAIHGTRFRNKLEAAGLDVAADLFSRDLWLEKPKVDPKAPLEFKMPARALRECPAQ